MSIVYGGEMISKRGDQSLPGCCHRSPRQVVRPVNIDVDLVAPVDRLLLQSCHLIRRKPGNELDRGQDVERHRANDGPGLPSLPISSRHSDNVSSILDPLNWGTEPVGQVVSRQGVLMDTAVQLAVPTSQPCMEGDVIQARRRVAAQNPPTEYANESYLVQGVSTYLHQLGLQHAHLFGGQLVTDLV